MQNVHESKIMSLISGLTPCLENGAVPDKAIECYRFVINKNIPHIGSLIEGLDW